MDDMVFKAFKMVIRAVKFLDIWLEDVAPTLVTSTTLHDLEAISEDTHVLETPPAETSLNSTESGIVQETTQCESATTDHMNEANNGTSYVKGNQEDSSSRPRYNRASHTFVRPGSSNSCMQTHRPPSIQAKRESVAHRVSCSVHPGSQNLASERLSSSHDTFLGYMGSFAGLHLQSRSSSELLLTTQRSVKACRVMLNVVEEVFDRDFKRSGLLEDARDDMYSRITDLVEATKGLFQSDSSDEDNGILILDAGKPLVDAATACVRGAGECVAETRFVIERIGDFELEASGEFISDLDDVEFPLPAAVRMPTTGSERSSQLSVEHYVPPEPSNKPPPPPTEPESQSLPSAQNASCSSSGRSSPYKDVGDETPEPSNASIVSLLPPLPPFAGLLSQDDYCSSSQSSVGSRVESYDISSSNGSSTCIGSMRDSENSVVSQTSTRATSPDGSISQNLALTSPSTSFTGSQSTFNDDCEDGEYKILEKTFAHELVYNKDGQISGGTLPALIERLTTYDSTPDATFVSTFYLTFRLFATPVEFAKALIDRFQYVNDNPRVAGPVRLRVYNVFKGWLESHWRNDCDISALELISPFATRQLQLVLPTAGKRLASLAEKASMTNGPLVPRLISSMGKTNTSIAQYVAPDSPMPVPVITKAQLAALNNWKHGGTSVSILDFDPLELARQFTLKESRIFCSILPEELLATEWMKKSGSMAVNVRAMSRLSTDLANLVAESILHIEDPKKRAVVIKQWVKTAKKCLELANYDSLMAIICSLNTSTILRLKRTWDLVSSKTKNTLEQLKGVVDCSRNYACLRQRLQNHVPPCLPFVGTYLTDLTFVDVGNQTTRQLSADSAGESRAVINFDKHMKTAKIISELQRFQIPYRFTEIPELQTWMQDQLVRMRTSDDCNVQNHYRRSLLLEPRASPIEAQTATFPAKEASQKFELFGLGKSHHHSKDKSPIIPN